MEGHALTPDGLPAEGAAVPWPGEVSADQLLAERRKVRHIWQALGLN